jgi:hypothetical protein
VVTDHGHFFVEEAEAVGDLTVQSMEALRELQHQQIGRHRDRISVHHPYLYLRHAEHLRRSNRGCHAPGVSTIGMPGG